MKIATTLTVAALMSAAVPALANSGVPTPGVYNSTVMRHENPSCLGGFTFPGIIEIGAVDADSFTWTFTFAGSIYPPDVLLCERAAGNGFICSGGHPETEDFEIDFFPIAGLRASIVFNISKTEAYDLLLRGDGRVMTNHLVTVTSCQGPDCEELLPGFRPCVDSWSYIYDLAP